MPSLLPKSHPQLGLTLWLYSTWTFSQSRSQTCVSLSKFGLSCPRAWGERKKLSPWGALLPSVLTLTGGTVTQLTPDLLQREHSGSIPAPSYGCHTAPNPNQQLPTELIWWVNTPKWALGPQRDESSPEGTQHPQQPPPAPDAAYRAFILKAHHQSADVTRRLVVHQHHGFIFWHCFNIITPFHYY